GGAESVRPTPAPRRAEPPPGRAGVRAATLAAGSRNPMDRRRSADPAPAATSTPGGPFRSTAEGRFDPGDSPQTGPPPAPDSPPTAPAAARSAPSRTPSRPRRKKP